MAVNVQRVFQDAQQLSPAEQLELFQAISQSLLRQYRQDTADSIPQHVKRSAPIDDLAHLAADFWPEDESADDVNAYIAAQRRDDLARES